MKKIISIIVAVFTLLCFSIVAGAETEKISFPMNINTGVINVKGTNAVETYLEPTIEKDDSIIVKITEAAPDIQSIDLVITGVKKNSTGAIDFLYGFVNYVDAECTIKATDTKGDYWKLVINSDFSFDNNILVNGFEYINKITIKITGNYETKSEEIYNDWGKNIKSTNEITTFEIVKNFNYETTFGELITNLINKPIKYDYTFKEVHYSYPFLAETDKNEDDIIVRNEVIKLSYSELGEGKGIEGFEGLASQIAEFFNGELEGTIVFKVTTAPIFVADVWNNGGIPSTQVGIYNPTTSTVNEAIGLFFNYDTTGSLIATAKIENDGTIIFDISSVLRALGGNTIGTIHSVYYGLTGGLTYKDQEVKGLKIEEVILSRDNKVTETVITETTTTTEPEPEVVIVEETTTTTTTEPEVAVDTTPAKEEDENPKTGVGVALAPMVICLAGLIGTVRKRR